MLIQLNDLTVGYDIKGSHGPWVTLIHSLGCDRTLWENQVTALADTFRVLTYDLRGHGESSTTLDRGSLALLANDLALLLEHLNIRQTHLVGLSIGGMISQTLAIARPSLVSSLVLANTSCETPDAALTLWAERIKMAREQGVAPLAAHSLNRWFTASFMNSHPDVIGVLREKFAGVSVDGYVACCEAIMGLDIGDQLRLLDVPALIIAGDQDLASPAFELKAMADLIPGANYSLIAGAGHLSNIDSPECFNTLLKYFLLH